MAINKLFLPCLIMRRVEEEDGSIKYYDPTEVISEGQVLVYSIDRRIFATTALSEINLENLSATYYDCLDFYFPSYLDFRQGIENRSSGTSYVFYGDLRDFVLHGGEIRYCYYYDSVKGLFLDQSGTYYKYLKQDNIFQPQKYDAALGYVHDSTKDDLTPDNSALFIPYLLLKNRYISEMQGSYQNHTLAIKWYDKTGRLRQEYLNKISDNSPLDPNFRAKIVQFVTDVNQYIKWSDVRIKVYDVSSGEETYYFVDSKTRALLNVFPSNQIIFQNSMATDELDEPGADRRDDLNNYLIVPKSTGAFYTLSFSNGNLIAQYNQYAQDSRGMSISFSWSIFNNRFINLNSNKQVVGNTSVLVSMDSCYWGGALASTPQYVYIANSAKSYWTGTDLMTYELVYTDPKPSGVEDYSNSEELITDGLSTYTSFHTENSKTIASFNLAFFESLGNIGDNTMIDLY